MNLEKEEYQFLKTNYMKSNEERAVNIQQQKMLRKNQAMELAEYKKRLRENVELKRLQVDELQLNIDYYKVKMEWRKLQPGIEALEEMELAEAQEMRQKSIDQNAMMMEKAKEKSSNESPLLKDDKSSTKTPKEIVIVEQGKPRA